ncbi:hypothetical protein SASPL_123111 [Salvia splendens]|uniref:Calmodulin-binding domain-containing protein n=1 Tax=Salvia splendens TaxID=180675 RepID=A0A8X8ZRS8_SALSN|nr:uncharacterized protein LOC121744567 [Salvia splendens]XP_041994089.1 uncharacterized protein LOC121744567 [Salvia splendens]KAG6415697.1 hypothetical protein SASPL_123111 [Salvia splendens]
MDSKALPNYLRPSSGSCHDICKYGRRRPLEEHPTKPRHKKTAKPSVAIPSPEKKEAGNGQPSPSSHAKSFSPRHKNTSSKRGVFQVKESSSVASKMFKQKGCHPTVKPSSPCHSSDGVCVKRRRNEDVQSRQPSILSSNTATSGGKTGMVKLLSPRKRVSSIESSRPSPSFQEEGDRESKKFEFVFKAVADAPSSSFHGDDDEESDKLASDTTLSQRKRRRMTRVVKPGDEHDLPVNLKFQTGKTMDQPEKSNAPRWLKFRSTRVDMIRADDSVNSCVLIRPLKPSRIRDKHRSSRNRYMRAQYGRTRILALEDKKGDRKRNWREDDVRRNHRQDKDFECLREESVSKLAQRRKGTVKSLVRNYETLVSCLIEQNWILKLKKNKP